MKCNCHQHGIANCIELVPIFSNLSTEEKKEVAAITRDKTLVKGEMVYLAGDKGEKLYVIHEGFVKISRLSPTGKEQVIRVLGPGEFMGELTLFSSLPMTDNAEAIADTIMCMIEGPQLKKLMPKYPAIAFKIMEELSYRLEKAENLIEDISLHSVEQRLAQSLLSLSQAQPKITLKMTKSDFASQIGMSQETLSRKLASLQEQGLIKLVGQRQIIILDRQGLEALV
ncbi:MAG TPA: Crp/Fnr family transcriptional regulator [Oscillospiraceae bacterium]|nr:Crp/Fnr family transcriptional regulator [Oscillospiraceae bacterium]